LGTAVAPALGNAHRRGRPRRSARTASSCVVQAGPGSARPSRPEARTRSPSMWYLVFVVEGHDEDFVMRGPGRLSEAFARRWAQQKLASALKVGARQVIHKDTVKEA